MYLFEIVGAYILYACSSHGCRIYTSVIRYHIILSIMCLMPIVHSKSFELKR